MVRFVCGALRYYYGVVTADSSSSPLTIHPDVSGRPHMLLILEEYVSVVVNQLCTKQPSYRLIEWINTHEGVEWVTMKVRASMRIERRI